MNRIYTLLFILLALLPAFTHAACSNGQLQVKVNLTPDSYPQETSWSLYDESTHTLLDTAGATSDSVCVPAGHCIKFTIYDTYGDGICCSYGNGHYTVTLNGVVVDSGSSYGHGKSAYFNCPPGNNCSNPFTAVIDTMTAPAPETWYAFTPDSVGLYSINTCNLGNTCDTKIYIYDHCQGLTVDEGNAGTTFYDDDGCQGTFQSKVTAALVAGTTYYIRIGDYDTSCAHRAIKWQIEFIGAIHGCTDPASCNYNPLATVSDSSCVYPPSSLCPGPDLAVDANELETSMYADNLSVGQTNCYISEGCLAGYGNRRLIRFSTHIRNIGNQDYYIGVPDTTLGQYVFDACHGHWHYVGYAEYLMYDAHNQPMQIGFKNGFCVLDLECSGGGQAKFGCSNMGITAGCGDIYNAGLDCQWIDITDIDTGNYTLVVRVNWDQSPDRLGHYEKTYDNNWAQVCLNLYYDNGGYKNFSILPNCTPFVDCAGDTFGHAIQDCNGMCNGNGIRGDLNASLVADSSDVDLYLQELTDETANYSLCNDLNGDSTITVTDAAKLNGCLLFNNGTHHHPGNFQNTHEHCNFPSNIINPFDSVTFAIADTNLVGHYVDLSVFNPSCYLLAYELQLHGLVVDSVRNIALGNYTPSLRSSATGHVVGMSVDENSLFKQLAPLNFVRVYFSALTDSFICIDKVIAVVNSNYEEVLGKAGPCVKVAQPTQDTTVISSAETLSPVNLSIIPNPSTGVFELYSQGKSLQGADVRITDALGRVVYQSHSNELSNHTTLDLSNQAGGVYLLHLTLNGRSIVSRLVLAR
jgi:hypothetical protein